MELLNSVCGGDGFIPQIVSMNNVSFEVINSINYSTNW
jgi:hypothetical protein